MHMNFKRITLILFLFPIGLWIIFLATHRPSSDNSPKCVFTGELNIPLPNFVEETFDFPAQVGFPADCRDIRFHYTREGNRSTLQWAYRIELQNFMNLAKRFEWQLQRTRPVGAMQKELRFLSESDEVENGYYLYVPDDWESSLYLFYNCEKSVLYSRPAQILKKVGDFGESMKDYAQSTSDQVEYAEDAVLINRTPVIAEV